MSWVKRRGPSNPNAAPPVPMYNPNQHSTQETNQWSNPQTHDNWYNQQQQYQSLQNQEHSTQPQNYWQPQHQQTYSASGYNQHYGQQYNQYQSGNFQNNLGYDQHPQGYGNMQYNQHYQQNNMFPNSQEITNQQNDGDAWNQAWGDEDNSNVQVKPTQSGDSSSRSGNIDDAFANDEAWNWGVEDSSLASSVTQAVSQKENTDSQSSFPKVSELPRRPIKPESESDLPKPPLNQDHLRLAGNRGKLNTPQWSTESQISQESSDDVLQTSESDKSHMLSRNSTISHSPLSGQDSAMGLHPDDGPARSETYENLPHFENKEIVSNAMLQRPNPTPPPPPPKHTQPQQYKSITGLTHKAANKYSSSTAQSDSRQSLYQSSFHTQQVNLETVPDNSEQPDPIPNQSFQKVKPVVPCPDNNEAPINDRNQYLETGQLSESNSQSFNQVSDNSTRSETNDSLPPPGLRRMVPGQLEQSEAGSNIGISYGSFGDLYSQVTNDIQTESNDSLPPPGLRRMVPGQMGQTEPLRSNGSFGSDEPPVGLSRMVLGQTENTASSAQLGTLNQNDNVRAQYEPPGPPEGLHRMVPGESSSPESHLQRPTHVDNEDSESEFQQLIQHTPQPRSATIGADTPPSVGGAVTNRSNGGSNGVQESSSRIRGGGLEGGRGGDKGGRKSGRTTSKESIDQNSRRDSIEGQPQETEVANLTNSIRNLAVGENLTDSQPLNPTLPEPTVRRLSRQESSDSEREHKKPPRVPRDRRSEERTKRDKDRDREKNRERDRDRDLYSPESYRDKKYDRRRYKDRRYEDETEDYYSDKEKDRRRDERDREYERKYNSLRKDKDKDRRRRDPRDYRRGDYYYERDRGYEDDYDNYENDNRSRPSSRSDSMHETYRDRHEKERRDRRQAERDRDRERDRYSRRRSNRKDVYNPYQNLSSMDPYHPYYQQYQYQYYENLRRTNPQAYAEWYRKYYQQATGQASSYGGEDRASVHSGRSSANDELAKDRYTRQSFYSQASHAAYYGDTHTHSISGHYGLDVSSYSRPYDRTDSSMNIEDTTLTAQRLTPAKFSTAHLKASITSGKLLRILPCYPIDGQNALVEICSLESLLQNDEEFKELNVFPGPLVKGVTHKKTIIEYCENKIKYALYNQDIVDSDSYILMWELLILLIRQNGMVVGTDIAELLLKNKKENYPQRPPSTLSSISSNVGEPASISESNNRHEAIGSVQSILKEEEVTNKFRDFLLYGSGQEALEWAMKHGLWGHALFLASKLDKRTHANVMMRFANGLTMNDPLQTLYQLLSGKMPAAVTCVSDEKWGDWRPHLAMILSNSTQRPELNCKAITTLGDTLRNRGSLYAAHFCYLMAEVGFGKYEDPETRLVLLGSDHNKPFPSFATNEAIHMTEIYEYACGLNDADFIIPQFQIYKYLLATRLADRGLLEKALAYLEKLSISILANPTAYHASFINNVCNLADKLKFYDPVGEVEDESQFGTILETSRPDHSWLKDLRAVQDDFQAGLITHESVTNLQNYSLSNLENEPSQQQVYDPSAQEAWQQQYDQYQQNSVQQQAWQPQEQAAPVEYNTQDNQQIPQHNDFSQNQYQELQQQQQQQQNYWPNQQQQWNDHQLNQYNQENADQQQNFYGGNAQVEPKEVQKDSTEEPQPQITLPHQQLRSQQSFDEEPKPQQPLAQKQPSSVKPKAAAPVQEKPQQGTGWFGGIFSKLTLKPKNQMKLPDDKNPKIVWDETKKRWVNLDDDSNDPTHEFKPPPKLADMMPKAQSPPAQSIPANPSVANSFPTGGLQPGPAIAYGNANTQPQSLPFNNSTTEDGSALKISQSNMFKMQRGRNLKNSYVDVFNPGGKPSGPTSLPAPDNFNSNSAPQMNFFIPAPIADLNAPVDFLTPGGVPHMPEQQKKN